jgi:hypothetical protein
LDDLLARLEVTREQPWLDGKLCRGPLVDGIGSYSLDIQERAYRDARRETWQQRAKEGNFPPLPPMERTAESY